ncbi:MAG: hypothetical protein COC12_14055 [Rhodobacteraceae bacterium]|nr:MAG: hypothetical protein COC12_14055 [Paracoccaceae bacterium]
MVFIVKRRRIVICFFIESEGAGITKNKGFIRCEIIFFCRSKLLFLMFEVRRCSYKFLSGWVFEQAIYIVIMTHKILRQ